MPIILSPFPVRRMILLVPPAVGHGSLSATVIIPLASVTVLGSGSLLLSTVAVVQVIIGDTPVVDFPALLDLLGLAAIRVVMAAIAAIVTTVTAIVIVELLLSSLSIAVLWIVAILLVRVKSSSIHGRLGWVLHLLCAWHHVHLRIRLPVGLAMVLVHLHLAFHHQLHHADAVIL